jgi:hypothetical protein
MKKLLVITAALMLGALVSAFAGRTTAEAASVPALDQAAVVASDATQVHYRYRRYYHRHYHRYYHRHYYRYYKRCTRWRYIGYGQARRWRRYY